MYCNNCGNQIEDGAVFCYHCGAKQDVQQPQESSFFHSAGMDLSNDETNSYAGYEQNMNYNDTVDMNNGYTYGANSSNNMYQPQMPNNNYNSYNNSNSSYNNNNYSTNNYNYNAYAPAPKTKKKTGMIIGICGGAAAVVIIALVLILFVGGRSWEATANAYVKASLNGDAKTIVSLIHPNVLKTLEKEEGITRAQFERMTESSISDASSLLNSYNITYEIDSSNYIEGSSLSSLQKEAQKYGIGNLSKAIKVNALVYVADKSSGKSANTTVTFTLVQIGKSWYLWK